MTPTQDTWLKGEGTLPALGFSLGATLWAWLIFTLGYKALFAGLQLSGLGNSLPDMTQSALATLVLFGLLAAPVILWARLSQQNLEFERQTFVSQGVLGLGLGILGVGLCLVYVLISNHLVPSPAHQGIHIGLLLVGLMLTLFQCASEEILFRGLIQRLLQNSFGLWIGLAAAAFIFGIIHVFVGAFSLLSLLNIMLAGAWFGLLYTKTRGLVAPIAAHFGWNWAEASLFGLYPNPGRDDWGSLFDFDMTGSALWGGSAEGLNTSLAATFVLIALCVVTALWTQRIEPEND